MHVLLEDTKVDMLGNVDGAQYVPVDTIICFRASIPLVIAVIEFVYMGRELPSPRSWAALFGAALTSGLRFSALMCMHASLLAMQCPVSLLFSQGLLWLGPLHAGPAKCAMQSTSTWVLNHQTAAFAAIPMSVLTFHAISSTVLGYQVKTLQLMQQTPNCAGVLGGVLVYTFHDIHFTVLGYVWIAIWYTFAVFEMVYVKIVVDSVQMTTCSRTYYQARPKEMVPFPGFSLGLAQQYRAGHQVQTLH